MPSEKLKIEVKEVVCEGISSNVTKPKKVGLTLLEMNHKTRR